jgi:hypothetical protein
MGFIIDRHKVKSVQWELDPDNYDLRLHHLGKGLEEFIVVNPIFDEWILDYIDTSISSDYCLMWVKKDKWIAKKFKGSWKPGDGWKIIETNFIVKKIKEFEVKEEHNVDIPDLFPKIEYNIEPEDYNLEHVWYLDPEYFVGDKIWVKKVTACDNPVGIKDMGYLKPSIVDELDVIFISYDELNAEENWQRLLKKVPFAQRVHGIKGIYEAHKAAAKLAQTDMFYVVDGDAEILDSWDFNFQPNIFNRDCVHVWPSRNPVNGLEYGYGGVKLFPRNLLLESTTWKVDMTTSVIHKLKVMKTVSNITSFDTDPFSTWRSAFRECTKLASNTIKNQVEDESTERLDVWCNVAHGPYASYAIEGAIAGRHYGEENRKNLDALKLINDREWLKERYNEQF